MYLDRGFRNKVIRQVHNDAHRTVAPSYGFDLVAVLQHAWRAWALETTQHVCVLSVFLIGYASHPPATVTALSAIGIWYLVLTMLRTAPTVLRLRTKKLIDRWMRRYDVSREDLQLPAQTRMLRVSAVGCVLLLVLPVSAAGAANVPLRDTTIVAMSLLVLVAGVIAAVGIVRQLELSVLSKATTFRSTKLTRRGESIARQQCDPLVVYRRPEPKGESDEALRLPDLDDVSGFFVGSGRLVHRWRPPLVVQLRRSRDGDGDDDAPREFAESPFKAHELVDHLRNAMKMIRRTTDPIRLPGPGVCDRVYVAETDMAAGRDESQVKAGLKDLKRIINDPHCVAHHFLEVSVTSSGELVTTVFLRVTVKGRSLSLDFAACALTRTPMDYQLYDTFARGGPRALLYSALRAVRDLPAEVAQMWRLSGTPLMLAGAVRARKGRSLFPYRRALVGTRLSVREEKSVSWHDSEFDHPTIFDQMKIVELRLLKATEEFLRSRGVDTSAFSKRAETIINASVLNMGGRVDINNSAVGPNAQVNHGAAHGTAPGTSTEGAQR
ncbi:hypothetical protein GCM10009780_81950 [Actinomadura alba]